MSVRLAADSSHLVAFDEDPVGYARLAEAVQAACADRICAFGWSNPTDPPTEIKALMARVRARDVVHDQATGRTTVLGAYAAEFSLTHDGAGSDQQLRDSRAIAQRESSQRANVKAAGLTPSTYRVRELANGWTLWSGRLRPLRSHQL